MNTNTTGHFRFIRNLGLSKKLMSAFLLVALIPLAIVIAFALSNSSDALNKQTYAQLEAVSEVKKSAIERHFNDIKAQLLFLSHSTILQSAASELTDAFTEQAYASKLTDPQYELLKHYYEGTFRDKYREENINSDSTFNIVTKLSESAQYWQYQYLADNPYPLGEKAKLSQARPSNSYNQAHARYHDFLLSFAQRFDFYDVFIVDNQSSQVIYSVYKEIDFATALVGGPFSNSNLATAFKKAKELNDNEVVFVDYQQYLPSYDAPASFIATPIFTQGVHSSTLIFQVSIDALNTIMTQRAGLGESGETYLVGQDYLMRSDSYLDPENHSVINSFRKPQTGSIKTVAVNAALKGEKGQKVITDYNNSQVLSSFQPINILGVHWALLAEIDKQEAFSAVTELTTVLLVILAICVVTILFLAFVFARSLTLPVQLLVDTMKHVEQQGDFSVRSPVLSHDEIGSSASAFNSLLDALQSSISQTNSVMNKMAQGEFNHRITNPCKGELDTLKQATNNCAHSLEQAMFALNSVIDEMSQGNFSSQISIPMQGELATLKQNINGSLQSLDSTISEIVDVMGHLEQGDFTQQVNGKARGTLEQLKESVNNSVQSLAGAMSDISQVMSALHDGDFSKRVEQPLPGQLALLKTDINSSVNNLSLIIADINHVMAAMRNGDFSQQLTMQMKGQLADLQNDVNNSLTITSAAISEVTCVLSALSQGDLNQQIEQDYLGVFATLKKDVNQTINKLTNVISSIQQSANLVSQSASEIAASNVEISRRTEEQAANLEEASASSSNMLDEVAQVGKQSSEAVNLAKDAQTAAVEGGELSKQTVSAICEVNNSSKDINEIVSVIDEIAFQTNLLALNAAVEAARAGEHGRGFAVVANEVRQLAGRSAASAKQIKGIIGTSNEKVSQGTLLATSSGTKLEQIVNAVEAVNQVTVSINSSTITQQQAIKEVDVVVQRLTTLIQENSAITEETMAAAKQMADQANSMRSALQYFTLKNIEPEQD